MEVLVDLSVSRCSRRRTSLLQLPFIRHAVNIPDRATDPSVADATSTAASCRYIRAVVA